MTQVMPYNPLAILEGWWVQINMNSPFLNEQDKTYTDSLDGQWCKVIKVYPEWVEIKFYPFGNADYHHRVMPRIAVKASKPNF